MRALRISVAASAVALVVTLFGILPMVAGAQTPAPADHPRWLAWLSGFLQNPLLLVVVGLASARVPKIRTVVSNKAIPYLQTVIAGAGVLVQFAANIVGPSPAHAMAGPLALEVAAPHVLIGFNFFGTAAGGLFGGVAAAAWQAAQAHIFYRLYMHKPLGPDPPNSRT